MTGKYVSFILGDVNYCIAVENVQQILRQDVLDTPKAHPSIKGVISLRGEVIPVVDMRARLGLPAETTGRKRRIIVVEYGRNTYGLLVDGVRDIVELDEAKKSRPASEQERALHILDLSGIFSADKGNAGRVDRVKGTSRE
jgi:purine-binding chemotaxis protein CheW